MGLVVTTTPEALKAHQKSVREHAKKGATKDALTEALAGAHIEHRDAGNRRASAKTELLASLQDA